MSRDDDDELAPAPGEDTLGPGEADLSDDGALDREGPGLVGTAELQPEHLKGALEALILVSDKPVQAIRLARLTQQDVGTVRKALAELAEEYQGRGIKLDEIAGGFQFRTSSRYAPFVRMLVQQKPQKLSRASLEALSIIAYRQPVTRPEIDDVRGVDSGSALKLLLDRNLIKIIGKKEEAGRPLLYGTTVDFLELFGLKNLRDLPTLREFSELTQESRDIFERRIGEPLPGQGQGMDMQTHYEAGVPGEGEDDESAADGTPVDDDATSQPDVDTGSDIGDDEDVGERDDDAQNADVNDRAPDADEPSRADDDDTDAISGEPLDPAPEAPDAEPPGFGDADADADDDDDER